jgi:MFS family permease
MTTAASDRTKWFALALLCAVQFMVILDVSIVNVALPSIQVDLGFSQENLQWVLSAYALVFGGFLLLGGRLADILGRRGVFLGGLVIFTVGSLLCGLAWSDESLIGARALQGLGAATITPSALSILTTTFTEGRERNIALGAWGAVGGAGAAAGVLMVASSPICSRGSGSSSSTSPSASPRSSSRRSCSPRAVTRTASRMTSPELPS